ncbi:hypothetical protein CDL12_00535 [Handroanthus impetiginosus]|uniref:cytokinin riboside 5'-monophosphate phosphoribohydrolase n=1 Tax=Handroanthus impetiginosus TaxID=429701 RepID=A0A2G9IAD9_9LAMI|nr:hypothetical protein CDL12_00535 [Handroanthus impetiginosus]
MEEEKRSRFKKICVFCGSSSGKKPSYQEAAVELRKELVERRIDLVHGGGSVGLMGLVSQAVHDGGRHVLGWLIMALLKSCLKLLHAWAQLGIHRKPVGLLNVEGYYNSLLSFLDKAVDEGFISPTARRIIVSAPTAKQLVRELEEHIPEYDEIISRLIWEVVERLDHMYESDMKTWHRSQRTMLIFGSTSFSTYR